MRVGSTSKFIFEIGPEMFHVSPNCNHNLSLCILRKIKQLRYIKLQPELMFCIGMELGSSPYGKKLNEGED
jgi:hypothetical protein